MGVITHVGICEDYRLFGYVEVWKRNAVFERDAIAYENIMAWEILNCRLSHLENVIVHDRYLTLRHKQLNCCHIFDPMPLQISS